jgi:hypothetical protein
MDPVESVQIAVLNHSNPIPLPPNDLHPVLREHSFGSFSIDFKNPLGPILYDIESIVAGKLPVNIASAAVMSTANCITDDHGATTTAKVPLGTMFTPDVEPLLQLTKPSPFGKGDATVFDEAIRKGLKLTADQFTIENEETLLNQIKPEIQEKLFPFMKEITFKRYKMALYQQGGHFDFNCDSVHATNHQATLLIEVRSAHEGGKLLIDHDGNVFKWSLDTQTNDRNDALHGLPSIRI